MSYLSEVLADSPYGVWLMDEPSGTTMLDSSGNGRHGTYAGGVTLAADGPAPGLPSAAQFDGTNDHAQVASIDLSGTNVVTVEWWARLAAFDSTERLVIELSPNFNGVNGFAIHTLPGPGPANRLVISVSQGSTYRTASIPQPTPDTWHFFSAVVSRESGGVSMLSMRVNGAAATLTSVNNGGIGGNFLGSTTLNFMSRNGTERFVNGRLAGVALFVGRLSDARRDAHYQAALDLTIDPAPVDLPLDVGTASLQFPTTIIHPAPIDLPLDVGATAFLHALRVDPAPVDLPLDVGTAGWQQTVWAAAPIDLPLQVGETAWDQTVWPAAPIDLPLILGDTTLQFPIFLSVPPVLHRTGAVEGLRVPPVVPPGQPVPIDVELRRGEGGVLLGRFRTAHVNRCSWTLNGIGEATLSWVPRRDAEPEIVDHLIAGGEPLTWWDADLEVWIYRAGQLVWCGPVVWQRHDPSTGRLDLRAWSREGYVKRLVAGRAGRTNLIPGGYFAPGLPGWSASQATITAVTSPLYRRPYSMRITATGPRPRATYSFTLGPYPRLNIVHFLIAIRYESGRGWDPDPGTRDPMAARIVRTVLDPSTGQPVAAPDIYPLTIDDSSGYSPTQWLRSIRPIRREAGRLNHYRIEVFGVPGGVVHAGEVEAVYTENIGAYAGDGRRFSAWVAALADGTTEYLAGDDWTYDVGAAGPVLTSSMRTEHHDHPQFWSLWEDATVYGDWWCPVQPDRVVRYRARRGRHRPELRIVGQQAASHLTTEWDGADDGVANEMIVLADGMDGPTREEGGAVLPTTGARLMRCEMAPLGTLPRDLDLYADRILSTEGRVPRRVAAAHSAGPAAGDDPHRRSLPGAFVHLAEPGDWTETRQVDGELDYTLTVTVDTMTWDAPADTVTFDWRGS